MFNFDYTDITYTANMNINLNSVYAIVLSVGR